MQKLAWLQGTVIMLLAMTLAGCGFHLRGHNNLPPKLKTLYYKNNQPYSSFSKTLKTYLGNNGVTFVNSAALAPITLNVTNAHFSYNTNSIGGSNVSQLYLLNYNIRYILSTADGKPIMPPQYVNVFSTYNTPQNQVFGSSNETSLLEQELQQKAIFQLMVKLSSDETKQALQKVAK